jgi:HAD superfamily hydrolase (TIGR01509 family)
VIAAVIFDLDGVLIDSEAIWDDVREAYVRDRGGRYDVVASHAMMGMSSFEWSRFIHEELGVSAPPDAINADVVELMAERFRLRLPLIDGAAAAVKAIGERFPLGLASSSNRPLIDLVLELSGLASLFSVTVSSEEVARGKPSPDVYLEAARLLRVDPAQCVAIEDSASGIRSAKAADMTVVAIPNRYCPPAEDALASADLVLASIADLTPGRLRAYG